MPHMLGVLLRLLALIAGVAFIFVAIYMTFAYRDEEERIQICLEGWWDRLALRTRQNAALSTHAVFMQEVARLYTRGLDRLWGRRIFSLTAAAVSLCYSVGAARLCIAILLRMVPALSSRARWF